MKVWPSFSLMKLREVLYLSETTIWMIANWMYLSSTANCLVLGPEEQKLTHDRFGYSRKWKTNCNFYNSSWCRCQARHIKSFVDEHLRLFISCIKITSGIVILLCAVGTTNYVVERAYLRTYWWIFGYSLHDKKRLKFIYFIHNDLITEQQIHNKYG